MAVMAPHHQLVTASFFMGWGMEAPALSLIQLRARRCVTLILRYRPSLSQRQGRSLLYLNTVWLATCHQTIPTHSSSPGSHMSRSPRGHQRPPLATTWETSRAVLNTWGSRFIRSFKEFDDRKSWTIYVVDFLFLHLNIIPQESAHTAHSDLGDPELAELLWLSLSFGQPLHCVLGSPAAPFPHSQRAMIGVICPGPLSRGWLITLLAPSYKNSLQASLPR